MAKKCRNCGCEMADSMNFCPQCHTKYEVPASVPVPPPAPAAEPNEAAPEQALNNKKKTVLIVAALIGAIAVAVALIVVIERIKKARENAAIESLNKASKAVDSSQSSTPQQKPKDENFDEDITPQDADGKSDTDDDAPKKKEAAEDDDEGFA